MSTEDKQKFPLKVKIIAFSIPTIVIIFAVLVSLNVINMEQGIAYELSGKNKIQVSVEAVFDRFSPPATSQYSGIITSARHSGNVTNFVLSDGFVVRQDGNFFEDQKNEIVAGRVISIKYSESGVICKATVRFDNGTTLIGVTDFSMINNPVLYNITVSRNSSPDCIGNKIIRDVISWNIIK